MAYNPYFPQPYQPYQPQTFAPTIRTEIVQVDNEEAAKAYPVGAGATQMMIARDDSAIYIKSALQNGQYSMEVFVKRPPAPEPEPFDPSLYVRRDELAAMLAGMRREPENEPV